MPYASLTNVDLYYETRGEPDPETPALLIVNGTGTDLRVKPNVLTWPVHTDRYSIAYDHRGLGQSVPHDVKHQPSMADFAQDAIELLAHLDVERVIVFGISFGGMVAQEIAISLSRDDATVLAGLVLFCTSTGGAGGASYPLHEVYPQPAATRDAILRSVGDTRIETDPSVQAFYDMLAANRPDIVITPGLLQQLSARQFHNTWGRLERISAPTFVGGGRFDGIAPPANVEALANQIPSSTLHMYDGGHLFFFQDRAAFADLNAFLPTVVA